MLHARQAWPAQVGNDPAPLPLSQDHGSHQSDASVRMEVGSALLTLRVARAHCAQHCIANSVGLLSSKAGAQSSATLRNHVNLVVCVSTVGSRDFFPAINGIK
jgi:hypothetical protein